MSEENCWTLSRGLGIIWLERSLFKFMNFERLILPTGLRLILIPKPHSFTTTIIVFVEAGSKYETKEINGISHFLEHMCFKGTKKRPRPIDIASELDGLGASYNAFTAQESTWYYIKAPNKDFDHILDIIADMYLNPVFDENEIEKEKGVIIEEINMYEDILPRKVSDLFINLLYGDQPAGWDIAGRKEVIRLLKREDLINYRSKHYLPQATAVIVSGGFEEKDLKEKVECAFSKQRSGEKHSKPKVEENQDKPAELVKFKDSDQTHLVLGFRAFNIFDPRRYVLEVLADILGGGMSSRLFQRIREEMGVAYYVSASTDLYSDHGYIAASAGIQHEQIASVIQAILEEFNRFKNEKVSEAELRRAKDHLVGHLYLSLETSDSLASFYGFQEIIQQKLLSPAEVEAKLRGVTAEEIQTVANELFLNQGLNLAVIGPFKEKTFSDILKI